MDKSERIERYGDNYLGDSDFEAVCVRYRQRKVIEVLRDAGAATIVEVGCGADLLFDAALAEGLAVQRWITVEPSRVLGDIARARAQTEPRFTVIDGFFEDTVEATRAALGERADAVLLSGVITEVPDPGPLLKAAHAVMDEQSLLHVNTANAYSLHRRLGRAMGLIEDEHQMTERNLRFEHFRIYDAESLAETVEAAGFRIEASGGYFLKPFTHAQMENTAGILTPDVLDGLYKLGEALPDLALEQFVNARRSQ